MEFFRQEYWSGLPFPSPGDLPNPGIKPGLLHCRQILYHLSHQESPKAAHFNTFRAESHSNSNTNTSCLALCIPFSQLLLLLFLLLLSSSEQKVQRFLQSARAGAQVHQRSFSHRVPPSARAEAEMARVQNLYQN